MRILIAGAGEVGTHLAKLLSRENMEISLMDEDPARLGVLDANYDLITKRGNPTEALMYRLPALFNKSPAAAIAAGDAKSQSHQRRKNMNSQNTKILSYLKRHKKGITSMEAFRLFNITRLSARISDLRNTGHSIKTIMEISKNSDGNTVNYARYTLEG